ncbi:hypothetical protein Tco_1001152, partial [Tanacetum coccineum]
KVCLYGKYELMWDMERHEVAVLFCIYPQMSELDFVLRMVINYKEN